MAPKLCGYYRGHTPHTRSRNRKKSKSVCPNHYMFKKTKELSDNWKVAKRAMETKEVVEIESD